MGITTTRKNPSKWPQGSNSCLMAEVPPPILSSFQVILPLANHKGPCVKGSVCIAKL